MEPTQNRDLGGLSAIVLYPFLAWRQAVLDAVPHIDIDVHETRRSSERQAWLYKQGREAPYLDKRVVTWTRQSLHQWGLALDWHFVRKAEPGVAVWDRDSYLWLYRQVPPEMFGLTSLPGDLNHLEFIFAEQAVINARELGLYMA